MSRKAKNIDFDELVPESAPKLKTGTWKPFQVPNTSMVYSPPLIVRGVGDMRVPITKIFAYLEEFSPDGPGIVTDSGVFLYAESDIEEFVEHRRLTNYELHQYCKSGKGLCIAIGEDFPITKEYPVYIETQDMPVPENIMIYPFSVGEILPATTHRLED